MGFDFHRRESEGVSGLGGSIGGCERGRESTDKKQGGKVMVVHGK